MAGAKEKNSKSPPRLLYEKTSLIRNYPFQYGKEYEPDFQRKPKPKPSIVDPKIFPTGKDHGKGASKILNVYMEHVLDQSQKKHQTQEIRLQHFTDHFLESSFDEQLRSVELNNIPLASSISIQQNLNKPNVDSSQKKFFVQFTTRLKNNDGLLIYARLQNMNISDSILKFLCSGISRNTRLKILMLHHNFITDKGLEHLCVALRHHPSIHTLWIGSNRITDFGTKALSQLISDNTGLKELNLSNQFRKMTFSQEEEDIRPFLTYISADYLANHLKRGSLLTSLTLSHQKMYDDGAILLYHALEFCQLRSLNLTNNHISDKSCLVLQHALQKNPLLEQLVLSKNEIRDTGAVAIAYGLAFNRNLSMLDLSENQIGEKGLFSLYRTLQCFNTSLKSLITVKNLFDDLRAEAIASTRNNSVFVLGIRNSLSMSYSKSFVQNSDSDLDLYRPRRLVKGGTPSQRELRRSLLMDPEEDGHIVDEIVQINQTIDSIAFDSQKKPGEDFDTPKLIARSLSRSSLLLKGNSDRKLSLALSDAGEAKVEQLSARETDPRKSSKPKSFVDMLKSPFGSSDPSPVAVPGVGIYGSRPLNLASIYEEESSSATATATELDQSQTIRQAIATAVRRVEAASPSPPHSPPTGVCVANDVSERPRGTSETRRSQDLGKTLGVPRIKGYGIKPIRTGLNSSVDSGQHLLYLRVSTEKDPPDARPYSLIKIGLDRRAERERTRLERQRPEYKEQKALKLSERPNKVQQEAAISRVSDRFWKDWELRMRDRYPRGIDLAKGCASTKLEPLQIPSAPINSSEIDFYTKYDRKDPLNPWNRYLEYKRHPSLAYQKHLGFHERKFAPGQILAARKKENFLQKISAEDEPVEESQVN